jgi:hypothetical protein
MKTYGRISGIHTEELDGSALHRVGIAGWAIGIPIHYVNEKAVSFEASTDAR